MKTYPEEFGIYSFHKYLFEYLLYEALSQEAWTQFKIKNKNKKQYIILQLPETCHTG